MAGSHLGLEGYIVEMSEEMFHVCQGVSGEQVSLQHNVNLSNPNKLNRLKFRNITWTIAVLITGSHQCYLCSQVPKLPPMMMIFKLATI